MGNEHSLTKDCKLEKEVPCPTPKTWRLYQSKRRDGSRVSVFVYETDQDSYGYIENAAKYLKVLRHPSILKFDGLENTSDGVWLATEQITPLENVLEEMSSAEIVAGIYNILEALVFLHERGGLTHNNVCLSSLFVAPDGTWKLGGVEFLCRFDQATAPYLTKCRVFRDSRALSPEEKAGNLDPSAPGWSRDVYAFGMMIEGLLEYLSDLGDLTKTFEIRVQDECLDPDANKRPKLSTFLQDRLFKNDFLQIVNFLKNVTLKSEEEKQEFFSGITEKLCRLSPEIVATRLVRLLLSRFILLDETACECLLPHLLATYKGEERPEFLEDATNPILGEKLFRKYVTPELYKIFHVRDAPIRIVLLRHFDSYMAQFDKEMLANNILPQLLLGLRDTNDELVRMTLQCVASLVPMLGGDIVVGTHRVKVFSEAKPKFGSKIPETGKTMPSDDQTIEPNGLIPTSPGSRSPKLVDGSRSPDPARELERERRREEAKRRSEERRKRRQERDKLANKANQDDTHNAESGLYDDKQEVQSTCKLSKPDWSDPEDEIPLTNVSQQTDSDIDLEIEKELDEMETTLPVNKVEKLKDKKSEQRPVTHSKHSSGALKLKTPKMRTSPPPPIRDKIIGSVSGESGSRGEGQVEGQGWGDTWEDKETWAEGGEEDSWNSNDWADMDNIAPQSNTRQSSVDKHSEAKNPVSPNNPASPKGRTKSPTSPKSRTKSPTSPISTRRPRTHSGSGLGAVSISKTNSTAKKPVAAPSRPITADVDIMSLDIKTSRSINPMSPTGEVDFFADMAPEIKMESDSLWGMLGKGSEVKGQGQKKVTVTAGEKKTGLSFAMTAHATEETTDGWGDEDLDWGQDDS